MTLMTKADLDEPPTAKERGLPTLLRAARAILLIGLMCTSPSARADDRIVVFAAASLSGAMGEILKAFNTAHRTNAVGAYASSGTLARQIENGAEPALFISANWNWMKALIEKGLIERKDTTSLVGNTLVLIAPRATKTDRNIPVLSPDYFASVLKNGERLAMGNPDHAPVGFYGREALTTLGLWTTVAPNIAVGQNASAAVTMVARGEAKLGLVYQSDIQGLTSVVKIASIPERSHEPIYYQAAPLTSRASDTKALKLLQFIKSSYAKTTFEKYGFKVLP
ncbi:MAG: molybdate ABC transporter substrate-binding protein [Pseudomonadota bacterium]